MFKFQRDVGKTPSATPKKGLHSVFSPFHLNSMATLIVEVTTFEEDDCFNQYISNEHGNSSTLRNEL
jgi:hypothetical protein